MKTSRTVATALIALGTALHTYTWLFEVPSFSIPFWLWSMSPYLAAATLLWLFHEPQAATGALVMPPIFDVANFYSVFISPESSTAGLGMVFVPMWNLLVFVPLGGGIGWWVGRRLREHALEQTVAADRREDAAPAER
jgi:hypothetical protein